MDEEILDPWSKHNTLDHEKLIKKLIPLNLELNLQNLASLQRRSFYEAKLNNFRIKRMENKFKNDIIENNPSTTRNHQNKLLKRVQSYQRFVSNQPDKNTVIKSTVDYDRRNKIVFK